MKKMNAKTSKPAKAAGAMEKKITLAKRVTNIKRHTTGYIDRQGRAYTLAQAHRLARQGRISGVRVVGQHLQTSGSRKLLDLPEVVK